MVKAKKGKGKAITKQTDLTDEAVEDIQRKLKNKSIIDAAEEGRLKSQISGTGHLHREGEDPFDLMLVYREKDATWYLGRSRILDNPDHEMNGAKIYEVKDQDRVLENLRNRVSFEADIMHLIIWKDTDTQDELVGWADPYQ